MMSLEYLCYEERLGDPGLFSLVKWKLRGITTNTQRMGAQRTQPGSFQWCTVPR